MGPNTAQAVLSLLVCGMPALSHPTSAPSPALAIAALQGAWRDCDDEDLPSRPKQFKPKSLVKASGGKRKGSSRKRKSSGKASGKRRKSGMFCHIVRGVCNCMLLLAAGRALYI